MWVEIKNMEIVYACKWYKDYKERSKELAIKWRKENPERSRLITKKYREKYPERKKARNALQHQVRKGAIKRLPCEVCGEVKVQAHHDDYSKPLDVRWLCTKHHGYVHMKVKK